MYPLFTLHFNDPFRRYKEPPVRLPEGFLKPRLPAVGYHRRGTVILHESLPGLGLSFGRIQVSCNGIVRGTWRLSSDCIVVGFSDVGQVQLAIRGYGDAIAPYEGWQSGAPVSSGSHYFFVNKGVHCLYYFACSHGLLDVLAAEHPALARLKIEPEGFTENPWQDYRVSDEDFNILSETLYTDKEHLPLYHFVQQQFGRLMGRYADRIDRYGDNPGAQVETVVMKAVEYIREHYTDPDLTMAVIAGAVNLSPDGLAKAFLRDNFRATRFINLLRVHHGAELLRTTDLPVGEVAYLSGFRDRSRFSVLFKEKFDANPNDFRNSLKNRDKS